MLPMATALPEPGMMMTSLPPLTAAPAVVAALTPLSVPLTLVVIPATGTGATNPIAAAGTMETSGQTWSAALAVEVLAKVVNPARTPPMDKLTLMVTAATGMQPMATALKDTGTTLISSLMTTAAHAVVALPTTSWLHGDGLEHVNQPAR